MVEKKSPKKRVYNTSPDFVPQSVFDISQEFIENFVSQDKDRFLFWYKLNAPGEDGKVLSFPKRRKSFALKYFPELYQKKSAAKKLTYQDELSERASRLFGEEEWGTMLRKRK